MAGQRLTHPEQSLSRKVTALSDFAYRVWEQTKLSADDFGVLPDSPLPLRADNRRLRKATEKAVAEALVTLVEAELLVRFEHQGEPYLCAPVWQTWQKVSYPRKTIRPCPPADVLARCDEDTRYLFTIHPGGVKLPSRRKSSGGTPEGFPEVSGNVSGMVQEISRAGAPHTPANAHANANASGSSSEGGAGETVPRPPRSTVASRASALGLVSAGAWDRQHASHALRGDLCDWVCLPQAVHDECVNRLTAAGESQAHAQAHVRAWALDVKARWLATGEIPGEDAFRFWRLEWAATHGSRRAAGPAPAAGLDALIAAGKGGPRG